MRKLTDEQRKQIIAEYAKGKKSQRTLAKEYGVTSTVIARLVSKGPCAKVCAKEAKKKNIQSTQIKIDYKNKNLTKNLICYNILCYKKKKNRFM